MDATMEHPGPPMRVPMSGLAITAFVLSLVIGLFSMSGVWIANVIPLLFVVFAWPGVSSGRRRGMGFAIAALVISLLAGLGSYLIGRAIIGVFEDSLGRFVAAVDKGDEAEARQWIVSGEDADTALAHWKDRVEKVHEKFGKYEGHVTVGSGLLGPYLGPLISMMMPPKDVKEIGTGDPPPALGPGTAWFWTQAAYEKGKVWVAIEIAQGDQESMKEAGSKVRMKMFRDVRFFAPSDSAE
jgi:hypothetical protein